MTKMYNKSVFLLVAVCCCRSICYGQPSPIQDREDKTPEAKYLTWEDERTLLILLDQSSDRTNVAQQVVLSANSNPSLTVDARCNGLEIAGHILYQNTEYDLSRLAFESLLSIAQTNSQTSESHRMIAQCHAAKLSFSLAIHHYEQSFLNEIDALTGDATYRSSVLLNNACSLADQTDDYQKLLELAALGLGQFYDPSNPTNTGAQYLQYTAYANLKLGNFTEAETHYTMLLDDFPDYGTEDKLMGLRPLLLIQLSESKGQIWDNCDKDLLRVAAGIVEKEQFYGMPTRIVIANKLATCLARGRQLDLAVSLRKTVIQQVDHEIQLLDPELSFNKLLIGSLREQQIFLMYNQALILHNHSINKADAEALLHEIVDRYPDAFPMITDLAQQLLNSI